MPAGHATNKGQMLISCILARSLCAPPHTIASHAHSMWVTGKTSKTFQIIIYVEYADLTSPSVRAGPKSPNKSQGKRQSDSVPDRHLCPLDGRRIGPGEAAPNVTEHFRCHPTGNGESDTQSWLQQSWPLPQHLSSHRSSCHDARLWGCTEWHICLVYGERADN